ncbi:MAG: exodeoxyribonuclease V subunit beta [Rickettsiaceae bacterium]
MTIVNFLQLKASDPEYSIWVSASAGTGKTKILTDRVLRLLLKGENFNRILCLTFTNAAAGEMKERIIKSLARWSTIDDSELANELYKVLGRNCSNKELLVAGKLYDSYIRSEDGINIQTIHSFCQKLLKKFPLEAGVSPGFKVIDEVKADAILKQIKNHLTSQPELELINEYLTINFHEIIIDEILSEIIQQKSKFLKNNVSAENLYAQSEKLIALLQCSFNDKYQELKANSLVQRIIGFGSTTKELKKFFLTDSGKKKKRIVPQKIAKPGSSLYADLEVLQDQIYALDQKEKALQLENHSKLLSLLGAKLLKEYEIYKSQKGLLDYDDLITKTCDLLNNSEAKEWVLYKLDGFVNHLLVDEAQDTSSEQWRIVEALIAEFYSGDSSNSKTERTVFVVGDEKQSIFSFQGADVDSFAAMNKLFKHKISASGKAFENVDLEISYRSATEILDVVYNVFAKIQSQDPSIISAPITQLQAFRNDHPGKVELWPICKIDDDQDKFWPFTAQESSANSAKALLAERIGSYIKDKIRSGKVLAATNKPISAGDFMILFRKRDDLTLEVIKALQNHGLVVSGLDRITLKENLSVQDLLSVARFVLNPQDDLNLATLLKSPIIGISEQALYDITTSRGNLPIWNSIIIKKENSQDHNHLFKSLYTLFKLYNQSTLGNFFQHIVDSLGFRQKLNKNNGPDSDDAINELLYTCQDFADQGDNSLQSFLFWLDNSDSSIKRENNAADKIKIMTVHASKGLQAPIVILCDTTSLPTNTDRFIWDKEGRRCLSAKNASDVPEYYQGLKKTEQQKSYAEYLRLLYVGMTRAEDELIICGYENSKSLPENCWYRLIKDSIQEIAIENADGTLMYGSDKGKLVAHNRASLGREEIIEWFYPEEQSQQHPRFRPTDYSNYQSLNYALLLAESPLEYGLIFHKILEDSIAIKNLNNMGNHPLIGTMSRKNQLRIRNSIEKIIANSAFGELIQNNVLTEASIGSVKDDQINLGRIDLLVRLEQEVVIVDYKSDINPPQHKGNIPESYKQQLYTYKNLIAEIYPNKLISTKILWLETGELMDL